MYMNYAQPHDIQGQTDRIKRNFKSIIIVDFNTFLSYQQMKQTKIKVENANSKTTELELMGVYGI